MLVQLGYFPDLYAARASIITFITFIFLFIKPYYKFKYIQEYNIIFRPVLSVYNNKLKTDYRYT